MQKAEQKFFKNRTIFYSTFPIQKQARSKDRFWDFELKAVYIIGILDFVFEENEPNKYRHNVKLTEQKTKKVFYDKLNYIYLEMPKFLKTEKELETRFDKWMFVLKNLPKLDIVPIELKEKMFLKLFETAEIAKLRPDEYKQYEASVNAYRDILNIKKTAFEKGIEKGKLEDAIKMLEKGLEISLISEITGLTEKKRIEKITNANKELRSKTSKLLIIFLFEQPFNFGR